MDRTALGEVAYKAWVVILRKQVCGPGGTFVNANGKRMAPNEWGELESPQREGFCVIGESVARYIAMNGQQVCDCECAPCGYCNEKL